MSLGPAGLERILVLGHRGFIGGHVLAHLRARYPGIEVAGLDAAEMDLTREESVRSQAGRFTGGTGLVILSGVKKQSGDTLETFALNIAMAVNLGRLLLERPVRRVLFFSTADVYGDEIHNLSVSEATPPAPGSYYGLAKFASEGVLRKAVAAGATGTFLALRMPFVYGPGDRTEIYGPLGFAQKALAGEPVTLWGDGTELRDFLLVDDLAEVVRRLLLHDAEGVVNVATGRSHTFREVVEAVSRSVPSPPEVRTRPRTREKVDVAFDTARLRALLPDFSFTPLEEGIRATLARHFPGQVPAP